MYFCTSSGCSCTASPKLQKMIPFSASVFLNVVVTETESNTASTATLGVRRFVGDAEQRLALIHRDAELFISIEKLRFGTSSMLLYFALRLGAE